jgi:hypothetical protein
MPSRSLSPHTYRWDHMPKTQERNRFADFLRLGTIDGKGKETPSDRKEARGEGPEVKMQKNHRTLFG